jgi:hypothetical protein
MAVPPDICTLKNTCKGEARNERANSISKGNG